MWLKPIWKTIWQIDQSENFFCNQRHRYGNQKTCHRLGGNILNTYHIWQSTQSRFYEEFLEISKKRQSKLAESKATFISPLQSTSSKIHLKYNRCLCPTHQDAREFHTSVLLKVGGLEHKEEMEPREQRRQCLQSHQLSPEPQKSWW